MKMAVIRYAWFLAFAALLTLPAGCGTSMPARFYRMNPTVAEGPGPGPAPGASGLSAGIGPVKLPAYLDRAQIVTRRSGSELAYAEYDRWAGTLQGNVADVLVEDVSAALAGEGVSVHPYDMRVPMDCQVEVRIYGFEGYPGKSVRLDAAWTVVCPPGGKVAASRRSVTEKEAQGADYTAYVDAMDRALAELAREISDALRALHAGGH